MIRPPQIEIDDDMAAQFALVVREARAAKSLPIHKVAKDLLLSTTQVLGLESGVAKSFYGARIYVQAARKYCAYLKVDFDTDLLIKYPPEPDVAVAPAIKPTRPASPLAGPIPAGHSPGADVPPSEVKTSPMRDVRPWMALSVALALALFFTQRSAWLHEPQKAPLPVASAAAEPVQREAEPEKPLNANEKADELALAHEAKAEQKGEPKPVPSAEGKASVRTEPKADTKADTRASVVAAQDPSATSNAQKKAAASVPETPADKPASAVVANEPPPPLVGSGDLRIRFSKAVWVEASYKHGKVIRRVFQPGQELLLDYPELKSLIIGSYSGVQTYLRENPKDLSAIHIPVGDVAKFSGSELVEFLQ